MAYGMKKEIWKDIKGYEGLYRISNWGRVWSYYKKGYKDLTHNGKYVTVHLSKNGKKERPYLHILVAKHFIPNPHNKEEVHHKDRNQDNNCVDNLMWVTHEEHLELHKDERRSLILKRDSKVVEMCTMDWSHEEYFPSAAECQRKTGISHGNISSCCRGKREYAGSKDGKKHRFRYINKESQAS